MNKVQTQILNRLSFVLFGTPTDVPISPAILDESKLQAVSSLITLDYGALATNIRVIKAHAELTDLLHDIPFTTIKGYSSAYYYPEPYYRAMGDVDFITTPEYYEAVVAKMLKNGWEKKNYPHSRHITFLKNGIEFELHHEIKGIPNGSDGIKVASQSAEKKVRAALDNLISTAVLVETQQGSIIIPDEFHHGLIMLLHIAGHIINDGGIGLRHLCDWAVYINHINFEQYRQQYESIGLWVFACQLTAVCSKYLGLPRQNWQGEWPEAFLTAFINDILDAGNFGSKESGRRASLLIRRRLLIDVTQERYPAARVPFLLPFFMIANIMRYIGLFITGKKKIIKPSTFSNAKKRDELYKQFMLFE